MPKSVLASLSTALLLVACATDVPTAPDHSLQGQAVRASAPSLAWDGSLGTVWTGGGVGSALTYDLGQVEDLTGVSIVWAMMRDRSTTFKLQMSSDGSSWRTLAAGLRSSATTGIFSDYPVGGQGRYLRIVNETRISLAIAELAVRRAPVTQAEDQALPPALRRLYVDCLAGDDAAAGTSADQALRSLDAVNALSLRPGDHVLFKAGCRFTGTLQAAASGRPETPIVYTRYGLGADPTFVLTRDGSAVYASGNHLLFTRLQATSSRPPIPAGAVKCPTTPVGYRVGFELAGQGITAQSVSASGLMAGVRLTGNSNRVLDSTFTDNTVMKRNTPGQYDDDSGAWGVLINSHDNEVSGNTFSGNWACSEDYGVDGASVELYEANDNRMERNISTQDITFTELGGTPETPSARNVFRDNIYAPTEVGGVFLTIRGHQSHWGGNPGTQFHRNIGYMVDLGINCTAGCAPDILSAYDNILWQRDRWGGYIEGKAALWADAPFDEGRNVFWKSDGQPYAGLARGALSATNRVANPQFSDPVALDFRSPLRSPLAVAGP